MTVETSLRRRLVLEAPVVTGDGAGGRQIAWSPVGEHFGAVTPSTGAETFVGSRQAQRVTHRVVVRCSPVGSGARPRPDQRFRAGSRVLAIRAVFERDGRGRLLTCLCEESSDP